jgi:hypothetical protein
MVEAKLFDTDASPNLAHFQSQLRVPAIQLVNRISQEKPECALARRHGIGYHKLTTYPANYTVDSQASKLSHRRLGNGGWLG